MIMANKKVFAINPQENYCETLAKKTIEISSLENLYKAKIFLPSRRAIAIFKNELLKASGKNSLIMPKIQAIGDIDELETNLENFSLNSDINERIANLKVISKYQEILILAELIKKSKEFGRGGLNSDKTISMHQATRLAISLLEILDNIKRYSNIDENFADEYIEELSKHKQISVSFVNFIRCEYPKILANMGYITALEKRNSILETFTKNLKYANRYDIIIIAGTLGTMPHTRNLIKEILQLKNGYYFLPFIDLNYNFDEEKENKNHHQYLVYENLKKLNIDKQQIELLGGTHKDFLANNNIKIIEAESLIEESKIIAFILRKNISENLSNALVTNNRNLANYVRIYLEKWGIKIDDSSGINFLDTNEGNFLLSLLNLISQKNIISLLALLRNKYCLTNLSTLEKNDLILKIENICRKNNIKNIFNLKNFIESFNCKNIIEAIEIIEKYQNSFSEKLSKIFSDVKILMQIFSNNDDIFFTDNFSEALEILDFLANDNNHNFTEIEYLAKLAEAFLSNIKIRPKYGVTSKLAILSPIEARLTNYNCYILGGLTLGSWPKENFSVWLNDKMKQEANLPNKDFFTSLANHDFMSLIASKNIFLTHSHKENGSINIESPILNRIKSQAEAKNINLFNNYFKNIVKNFEEYEFENTPKTIQKPYPKPQLNLRPNTISATEIETLLYNPYEFYAKKILRLKPLDELERDSDAKEYGNFIHKIMEEFSNFHNLDISKITQENFNNIANKIYADFNSKNLANESWLFKVAIMSEKILDIEKEVQPQIKNIICENSGEVTLKINENEITIKCKADRIEKYNEYTYSISDYKTGEIPNKNDIKTLKKPQILVEAIILNNNGFNFQKENSNLPEDVIINEISYYKLSKSKKYPSREQYEIPDLELVKENLVSLLSDLLNPEKPFLIAPRGDLTPKYRNYFHLERVS